MEHHNLFESIKRNLNGRPGQPIVLGVCKALARRCGHEVWVFRAAAIVLGVFFTFATLAAYVLLGLFMPETEERTKGVFRGLGIWLQEMVDRLAALGREFFSGPTQRDGSSG
jgi:phage shock protein PspC (stress-responsive transcriptional regulator)